MSQKSLNVQEDTASRPQSSKVKADKLEQPEVKNLEHGVSQGNVAFDRKPSAIDKASEELAHRIKSGHESGENILAKNHPSQEGSKQQTNE